MLWMYVSVFIHSYPLVKYIFECLCLSVSVQTQASDITSSWLLSPFAQVHVYVRFNRNAIPVNNVREIASCKDNFLSPFFAWVKTAKSRIQFVSIRFDSCISVPPWSVYQRRVFAFIYTFTITNTWALFFPSFSWNVYAQMLSFVSKYEWMLVVRLNFLVYNLYICLKSNNSLCNAWCVWMSVSFLRQTWSYHFRSNV